MEEETKKMLQAILAVLMESRDDEAKTRRKDETFLADQGLNSQEIATILGKTHAAVTKALQRARNSKK